jgi:hypothetical protein
LPEPPVELPRLDQSGLRYTQERKKTRLPTCVDELSELSELAKRYRGKRLLVAGVTTYKANSYLTPSTHANIENQIEKERRARAPNLPFVITSETSLADYGVEAYPVVAVVDKTGTLRYIGRSMDFDDDDPLGHLIHKLVKE